MLVYFTTEDTGDTEENYKEKPKEKPDSGGD
jgi:hypothetical protein